MLRFGAFHHVGRRLATLAVGLGLCGGLARASPVQVALTPQTTQVGLTSYALGVIAQAGRFTSFSGTLDVDPQAPQACQVRIDIAAASLVMARQPQTLLALGPRLLDAARFPKLHFEGACQGDKLTGKLSLHGVTRDLALATHRTGDMIAAIGSLHRQDFDMTRLPGLIGGRVDMAITVQLPAGLGAQLRR